jgi:hypothetical protein
MGKNLRLVVACSIAMTAALLVVGVVSHGVLRHIVQTSPLWIPIALAVRGSALAKWAALPCFAFWLLLMTAIWLYLLGWARIITGTFSPTEIAMTVAVGLASMVGIAAAIGTRSSIRASSAVATTLGVALLQIIALRISLLPQIAHR